MAKQAKSSKKQRAHKVSKGIHGGGGKVRLNEVQKVLLNGGLYRRLKDVPTRQKDVAEA